MRIGIDIRPLMDKQYSGVSEYTYSLVKEILKLDKRNEYVLYYNSGRDISQRMPQFEKENVNCVHTRYPNKLFNYCLQKAVHWPKIDKLLGVDILFLPHLNFVSFSRGQAKKIITIHDLSFLRFPEFFSIRKNIWHQAINIKKLLKKFDIIIAVSENTKADICELCQIEEQRVKVIYSGVESDRQTAPSFQQNQAVKEKYNLPDKFILYLGNLEPRKNISGLINAYGKLQNESPELKEYYLILAGGRCWKSRQIFQAREKSKFKNKIKIIGYVDKKDKPGLYSLASAFAYPSFYEGFGFPPLEAMAGGCPAIISSAASLPEVCGPAAVMIDPFNQSELASALRQVLLDDKLRRQLIAAGHSLVKNFSWENSAWQYLKVFDNI